MTLKLINATVTTLCLYFWCFLCLAPMLLDIFLAVWVRLVPGRGRHCRVSFHKDCWNIGLDWTVAGNSVDVWFHPFPCIILNVTWWWPMARTIGACKLAPPGWECTREVNHRGACAARRLP